MSPKIALMADEAFATGKIPPGYSVIAGYLSSPAAYHPWSNSDWAKFGTMKKLPIFVASKATGLAGTGDSDAFSCLEQLYKLGVPKGSAVGLDMETAVDASYVKDFSNALQWAGYRTWVYGSASSVFLNPQPSYGGYWVADYKGIGPFMYKHPGVRATQYESGSEYDSSLIKWWDYLFALKSW
jgi:hypothetical protein